MLRIHELYKKYGKSTALDRLSLHINEGEMYGFVGPNGAGKTTTMKIVAGLLDADGGQVYVDGIDAIKYPKRVKEKIAYMPDFFGVYDNLKVLEYMKFFASIYDIDKKAETYCMELLEMVGLNNKTGCYVDELSRGMKQKLCLARCLIHDPKLLILDEPASGMDPKARFEFREILKRLNQLGKTVLISSHILTELAELCTNIGIIDKGKLLLSDTIDEVFKTLNTSSPLVITVLDDVEKTVSCLRNNPFIENLSFKENSIRINTTGDLHMEALLLKMLIDKGILVTEFRRERRNLESVFLKIIEGKDNDEDEPGV